MFETDRQRAADSRRGRMPGKAAPRQPRAMRLGRTATLVRGRQVSGRRDLFGGYAPILL
jgi:hypothetical protein